MLRVACHILLSVLIVSANCYMLREENLDVAIPTEFYAAYAALLLISIGVCLKPYLRRGTGETRKVCI